MAGCPLRCPQELLGLQQDREGKASDDDHDVYAEKWDDDISHWRGRIKGPVSICNKPSSEAAISSCFALRTYPSWTPAPRMLNFLFVPLWPAGHTLRRRRLSPGHKHPRRLSLQPTKGINLQDLLISLYMLSGWFHDYKHG